MSKPVAMMGGGANDAPALASYYNSRWFVLYVQTPDENSDRIKLDVQRHLINNLKVAAEVIQVKSSNIVNSIMVEVEKRNATTVCIGKPHVTLIQIILKTNAFNQLLTKLSGSDTDLIILS